MIIKLEKYLYETIDTQFTHTLLVPKTKIQKYKNHKNVLYLHIH